MAGSIALVGGDEFRSGCEDMDRAILEATGVSQPRVLIVPTAATHQNPSMAASNGVAYFEALGANAARLMVLDAEDAGNEELLSPVDDAHLIYLTGGAPNYLLGVLRDSRLLSLLNKALDRGMIIAGSSAGAMVLGSQMRYRGWIRALGFVERVAVLPHHERAKPATVAEGLDASAPPRIAVLGIDSMTCCFGDSDGWRVLGPGAVRLYQHGHWRRYVYGDTVPLPTSLSDYSS